MSLRSAATAAVVGHSMRAYYLADCRRRAAHRQRVSAVGLRRRRRGARSKTRRSLGPGARRRSPSSSRLSASRPVETPGIRSCSSVSWRSGVNLFGQRVMMRAAEDRAWVDAQKTSIVYGLEARPPAKASTGSGIYLGAAASAVLVLFGLTIVVRRASRRICPRTTMMCRSANNENHRSAQSRFRRCVHVLRPGERRRRRRTACRSNRFSPTSRP